MDGVRTATGAPDLYPEALRDEIDEVNAGVYRDVNNGGLPGRVRRRQDAYEEAYRALFARSTGWRSGWPASGTWSATRSPRPTSGCSPRWSASTPSTTATSSATATSSPRCRCCGPTLRDLFQTPGFGDTVDFDHIKRHYYRVHTDINPTRIVPAGPDLSGWLTPHGREELGGRPFGDGTPPGPPPADEVIAQQL